MAHREVEEKLDRMISKLLKSDKVDIVDNDWGNLTYSSLFRNKMAIIALIRAGIPYRLFSLIQDYTPFSEAEWANFLDISIKSLQRYKQGDKNFRPIQSEKIIELAEVTNIGLEVFEDRDKFKLWLETPNYVLGRLKPVELLKDSYGKNLVIAELTRIHHGILPDGNLQTVTKRVCSQPVRRRCCDEGSRMELYRY